MFVMWLVQTAWLNEPRPAYGMFILGKENETCCERSFLLGEKDW